MSKELAMSSTKTSILSNPSTSVRTSSDTQWVLEFCARVTNHPGLDSLRTSSSCFFEEIFLTDKSLLDDDEIVSFNGTELPRDNLRLKSQPERGSSRRSSSLYISQMWTRQLLTREQEQRLFRKFNFLKFVVEVLKLDLNGCIGCYLINDQIKKFDEKAQVIRAKLIESNLRLVVAIAKRYSLKDADAFDEYVSVGNIALVRSVDCFDYRRRLCFSTYAYQSIQRAIYEIYRRESRYKKVVSPDIDDATNLAIKDAAADHWLEADKKEIGHQVRSLIQKLDTRSQHILKSRFGIDRDSGKTPFNVIAKELGLSTTRTVQLFHRSVEQFKIESLKHSS